MIANGGSMKFGGRCGNVTPNWSVSPEIGGRDIVGF
jgi:hypothetical protein